MVLTSKTSARQTRRRVPPESPAALVLDPAVWQLGPLLQPRLVHPRTGVDQRHVSGPDLARDGAAGCVRCGCLMARTKNAETEPVIFPAGYSIFAVVSANDGQLGGLPPCAAEEVARTLPPPRGGGSNGNTNSGAFSGSGHSLGGGGSNAFASTSSASTSSGSVSGAFSTTTAMNGQNGFASSARKGKRAASPDDAMGQDDDDDDDDIIIEDGTSGKKSKSSVDSASEKRRRRRRLEQKHIDGRGTETAPGAAALPPGLSEEEQMAAAIAASLNVSGSGAARGEGGSGSGSWTSTTTDPKVRCRRPSALSVVPVGRKGSGLIRFSGPLRTGPRWRRFE